MGIYARLEYTGQHVCMSELYPEGTILTSGFFKGSSAGGWRLGYAHYPQPLHQLRKAVLSGASHTYSCAPAPLQHAVARAILRSSMLLLEQFSGQHAVARAILGSSMLLLEQF